MLEPFQKIAEVYLWATATVGKAGLGAGVDPWKTPGFFRALLYG